LSTLVSRDQSGVLQAQRGETEDLRTRGCKRWLVRENADGSRTYRVGASIGPIHYREDPFDERADWHEIDLDLEAAPAADSWDWQCLTNGYQVRVWQDGYAAEFRRARQYVRMRPAALAWMNAAGKRQAIAKPVAGIKPTIDNEQHFIEWADLFGKGLDFRYNLSPDKFFKTVVVRSADALPRPTIGTKGLRLVVVMALAFDGWPDNGFTGNIDCRALSATDIGEGTADEVLDEPERHAHLRTDGREAFWVKPPRAWDSAEEPVELPMRWRLERRGGDVFGLFSVAATDLKSATFPVYVDAAIAEEQVGASSNDATASAATIAWDYNNTYDAVNATRTNPLCGFRFTTVPIPQGATIDSASWTPYVYSSTTDDPYCDIYGDDADSAADFSSGKPEDRAYTTAAVSWIATAIGTGFVQSPDIASIVQEIVNRVGWASGNSLALLTIDPGVNYAFTVYQWDYSDNSRASKFNCTYTAGGASAIPAIMHHYRQLRSR
jgi:hypothetical protein